MPVADDLIANIITSHQSSQQTNKALKLLDMAMGMYLLSGSFRGLEGSRDHDWWWRIQAKRNDTMRLGTLDLDSLLQQGGQPYFLGVTHRDPRGDDGSGKYRDHARRIHSLSKRPVAMVAPAHVTRYVIDYLRRVIRNELNAVSTIASAVTPAGYRAIVSIDYYSSRPTNTHVLHKDTVGNTLFVALHYLNPEPMLGPEYIRDKWPIRSDDDGSLEFTTTYVDRRGSAPWKVDANNRGRCYWPRQLLKDLEKARNKIVDPIPKLQHVNLAANGLVSFVDELIYHATPWGGKRVEKPNQRLFEYVKFSGHEFSVLPRMKRSISIDKDLGRPILSPTGGADARKFVRLWISIVPEDWYSRVLRV